MAKAATLSKAEYEAELAKNAAEGKRVDAMVATSGTALASPMVSKLTPEDIEALQLGVNRGELEASPVFIAIEAGMVVRGTLVGSARTEVEDRNTREMKAVPTWIMADDKGNRVQFLSTFQLDNELNSVNGETGEVVPKLGRYVTIARLDDERSGKGNTVARWRVFFAKERG